MWGPCEAKLCWSATGMIDVKMAVKLWVKDEMVPIRCKLQSLLAVSVTVPVYINSENLTKWRTDLQSKTKIY